MPQFPIRITSQSQQQQQESNLRRRPIVTGELAERIRIKNRRKRYLELHPDYFQTSSLGLSDPLLYDRLVRRFMTTSERDLTSRHRDTNFSTAWEAQIVRAEEVRRNPALIQHPTLHSDRPESRIVVIEDAVDDGAADDDLVQTRDEGWQRWVQVMTRKFLAGRDREFDYTAVDNDEAYDGGPEEELDALDAMEARIAADDAESVDVMELTGQTGVQDF